MPDINWDDTAALIDSYTPQELYVGYNKIETLPKFFSDQLINQETKYHKTKKFQFDIKDERATVPTYCTPKSQSTLVEFTGYETVESTTPYINEAIEITVDDFETRPFGIDAAQWGMMDMGSRMVFIMADKDRQMHKRMDAVWEVQIAEQLQTGIIPVSGKDVELEISVRMPATHLVTLTGDARWSQVASLGARISSIKAEIIKMRDDRGGAATDIYMDPLSYAALSTDPEFFDRMNRRRTPEGSYNPVKVDESGFIEDMGVLTIDSYNVRIWVNSAVYTDSTQTEVPYIKAWNYILVNRNVLPVRKHQGLIHNLKAMSSGLATSDMYTFMKMDDDGKWLRKQYETAPVAACEDMSSVITVTTHTA